MTRTPMRLPRKPIVISRPEIAVICGVVIIILSLVFSTTAAVLQQRKLSMARADIRVLIAAGTRFFGEYRNWPTLYTGDFGDHHYGYDETSNAEVLNALLARDDIGNENHGVNPSRITFIDLPSAAKGRSGLRSDGAFVDPWGSEYQIVLDTDFDSTCNLERSIYANVIGEGIIVWSYGPDRKGDTPDDILSWKR